MGKHITDLPLELLVKITLTINDICTLEYWLACVNILEDVEAVKKYRCNLTITTKYKERYRSKYDINETRLLNFKLSQITDDIERSRCKFYWNSSYNKTGYDIFMRQYGHIWLNSTKEEEKKITLIFHSGANVIECHCGTIIKGQHNCIKEAEESVTKIQVINCCFKDYYDYMKNNKCDVCREDDEDNYYF